MYGYIDHSGANQPVPQQRDRFVSERGKCRKSSNDTDKQEKASLGRKYIHIIRASTQETDDETPKQIDQERPVREIIIFKQILKYSTAQISKDRADKPAQSDDKNVYDVVHIIFALSIILKNDELYPTHGFVMTSHKIINIYL